jgi:Phage integrase family
VRAAWWTGRSRAPTPGDGDCPLRRRPLRSRLQAPPEEHRRYPQHPLAGLVVEELRRRRPAERSSLLFPDASRYRLRHAYLRAVRQARKHGHLLGLDLRGPHDLRHTFATWLEDDGIPARVIDELMGHAATRRSAWAADGMSAMGAVYRHTTTAMEARIIQALDTRLAEAGRGGRGLRLTGQQTGRRPLHATWVRSDRPFPLVLTHETPGDSRVRALPSPVCTPLAGRQNRRKETVADRGECPARRRYARWFAITNVHGLLQASQPSQGSSAARLLPPLGCLLGGDTTDLWSQQRHDDVVDHRHDVVVGHRGAVGEEPLHH